LVSPERIAPLSAAQTKEKHPNKIKIMMVNINFFLLIVYLFSWFCTFLKKDYTDQFLQNRKNKKAPKEDIFL
jgi:hypothetical protein